VTSSAGDAVTSGISAGGFVARPRRVGAAGASAGGSSTTGGGAAAASGAGTGALRRRKRLPPLPLRCKTEKLSGMMYGAGRVKPAPSSCCRKPGLHG